MIIHLRVDAKPFLIVKTLDSKFRVPDGPEAQLLTTETIFLQTLNRNALALTLWLYQFLGFLVPFILGVLCVPDLKLALSCNLPLWVSAWFMVSVQCEGQT